VPGASVTDDKPLELDSAVPNDTVLLEPLEAAVQLAGPEQLIPVAVAEPLDARVSAPVPLGSADDAVSLKVLLNGSVLSAG